MEDQEHTSWQSEQAARPGAANAWSILSVDAERYLVFCRPADRALISMAASAWRTTATPTRWWRSGPQPASSSGTERAPLAADETKTLAARRAGEGSRPKGTGRSPLVKIPLLALELRDQITAQEAVGHSTGRERCALLDEREQRPQPFIVGRGQRFEVESLESLVLASRTLVRLALNAEGIRRSACSASCDTPSCDGSPRG